VLCVFVVTSCATEHRLRTVATATTVVDATATTVAGARPPATVVGSGTSTGPESNTTIASPSTTTPALITVASVTELPPPATTVTATASTAPQPATVTVTDTNPAIGTARALDALVLIRVQNEHPAGYARDRFGYPRDVDGDGCDTRAEVLIRDSTSPVQVDPSGCGIVAGDWYSPYDGRTWSDPAELEIDHVVPLKEAWDSGAWAWDPAALVAYGNDLDDPRSLRAVTSAQNLGKGDKDPSNWIPPNADDVCSYLSDWVAIKARWGLTMDQSEFGRIRNLLTERCPEQRVGPWPAAPSTTALVPGSSPNPTQATALLPVVGASPDGGCDPAYPTVCIPSPPPDLDCGDVPYRRFTVLARDPHHFDADHNGVGCESA